MVEQIIEEVSDWDVSPELMVTANGDRLDKWLAENLPQLSRARCQKLIESGQVWCNGVICQNKKQILKMGDRLSVNIPELVPLDLVPQTIPLDILYEDDQLIIINKPAGLVVHPGPGHPDGTVVNALLAHCPDLAGIGGVQRPGIVHRLDKDTTGAMVIAKTELALHNLQAQLKEKTARRLYWGIVYGAPRETQGTVELPVGRHPGDRLKMGIVPPEKGGRSAVTHWRLLERLGNHSWLEFRLETGRTHQIRVHSKQMGHPLVGDNLYTSPGNLNVNLPGQALHAHQLSLIHPVSGETITAIAPMPAHFEKLLTYLRQRMH
ncbi:RluA family pseudouridine synthase [Synechocystis sp. PCC 7339]|uniref:RluA family pseudouridine synthase n=1 Tax=unclassified Synechocystis TaxID=2640012 RepID=UPI001BB02B7C|nr:MULTISPECIES: RluA family pseudouridine synthase [unclassified Synechocystis]QUS61990.1 RluA family pseudouridine synthase [Synechocystis sp. PCC 7338]UAJ74187.1 RluA family pseudouridine synthase [Synechocystis sp. PCC 7339]